MLIVGAGMAGLLAANVLQRRNPVVIEAQKALPNNHSAVLRFRSPVVGDVLGIPFKRVSMIKATAPWRNPVADSLQYSFKNTGGYRSDRSVNAGAVFEERFIAPPNLIARMAEPLRHSIEFERSYARDKFSYKCIISTMPMNMLMEILDYPHREEIEFTYSSGFNVRACVQDCDAYVSLMVPDPDLPFSRVSITGDELIAECIGDVLGDDKPTSIGEISRSAADLLGVKIVSGSAEAKRSKYAKINPIDDRARKEFMHWATTQHGIYSLGRFATWRPGLLLDDLVSDIRLIDQWSQNGDMYSINKRRVRNVQI